MQLFGEGFWFDGFKYNAFFAGSVMQVLADLETNVQILLACILFLDLAVLFQISIDTFIC